MAHPPDGPPRPRRRETPRRPRRTAPRTGPAQEPAEDSGSGRAPRRRPSAEPPPRTSRDFTPMLASPGTTADLPDMDWQFELKWDGVRALVVADSGPHPPVQPQRQRCDGDVPRADRPLLLAGTGLHRRRRDHRRRALRETGFRAAAGADETDQTVRRGEGPADHPRAVDAVRSAVRRREGPPPPSAGQTPGPPGDVFPSFRLPGGTLRA